LTIDTLTRYTVSFKIAHDELDPVEITKILGIIPNVTHKKGDTRLTKSGKPIKSEFFPTYPTGIWGIAHQSGFDITPSVLLKMGELGLVFGLCIY